MSEPGIPRASNPQFVERQRLRAIARPYAKDIMKWQARLAFYRQRRDAARATNEDAFLAGARLSDLLTEVEGAQARFRSATSNEPMVGAIEDVTRSLQRLTEQISAELP